MRKFWNWDECEGERTLFLNGIIAEESWFDDEISPKIFKDELFKGEGDIVLWINSPGGDCIAAAQIYNMLMEYPGNVKVKVDGIAASAASVIAMAGGEVLMSPVSMLMIHNPMTLAWGDAMEMNRARDMLEEVKESIINAYELKTGLSRTKISHLMDNETWMDAKKAVEFGFADKILYTEKAQEREIEGTIYSGRKMTATLTNKLRNHFNIEEETKGRSIKELEERLFITKEIIRR